MSDAVEQRDAVSRLHDLFKTTNEWLRFAEAKNGAVVAAALALTVGVSTIIDWTVPMASWSWGRWYLILVLVQLVAAASASLVSFLPRTDIGRLTPRGERSDDDNLLYFGHVAKYSPKFFLKAVRELEELGAESASKLESSYAEQAVANSRIALWKFRCATWAIRLFLAALVTAPVVYFIEGRFHEDGK